MIADIINKSTLCSLQELGLKTEGAAWIVE
jgi:hypothetical protein